MVPDDFVKAEIDKLVSEAIYTRKLEGVSQFQLAERLGIQQNVVSQFDARRSAEPKLSNIMRYLYVLGYKVNLSIEPLDSGQS